MLATQPDIDTISITRTFDGIEAAAHRVISQMGGMASVIKDAKIAVLKPNFVAGRAGGQLGRATRCHLLWHGAERRGVVRTGLDHRALGLCNHSRGVGRDRVRSRQPAGDASPARARLDVFRPPRGADDAPPREPRLESSGADAGNGTERTQGLVARGRRTRVEHDERGR